MIKTIELNREELEWELSRISVPYKQIHDIPDRNSIETVEWRNLLPEEIFSIVCHFFPEHYTKTTSND